MIDCYNKFSSTLSHLYFRNGDQNNPIPMLLISFQKNSHGANVALK